MILRQGRRPPRPKSEVFLSKDNRKSKRYSAFGVSKVITISVGISGERKTATHMHNSCSVVVENRSRA